MRDRVKDFRRVRAGDLVANRKNWRRHPEGQKTALRGILDDVGFVGAVVARELSDGRLELLDGHMRHSVAKEAPILTLL